MKSKALNQIEMSTTELLDIKTALDEFAIVAVTDKRGIITSVNGRFCGISKYTREELIGQDHRILNSGHHPKSFSEKCGRRLVTVKHGTEKFAIAQKTALFIGCKLQLSRF